MQKLPQAPARKRGGACAKKRNLPDKRKNLIPLSAVTSGVTTPKYFLLVVEGAMRSSLDDALANISTSSNRLFY